MNPKLSSPVTSRTTNQVLSGSRAVLTSAATQATSWPSEAATTRSPPTIANPIVDVAAEDRLKDVISDPETVHVPVQRTAATVTSASRIPAITAARLPTKMRLISGLDMVM